MAHFGLNFEVSSIRHFSNPINCVDFSASTLGAAITLPVSGLLISAWGWESVFYITGLVGVAWSILWFNLVFETPAQHPRISDYEKHYIESQIAKQSCSGSKVIYIVNNVSNKK